MNEKKLIKVINLVKSHRINPGIFRRIRGFFQPERSEFPQIIPAVRELTFEIQRGQFFCVLGVKGAGKTTLLNLLSGKMQADAGSVERFGKVLYLPYPVPETPLDLSGRILTRNILRAQGLSEIIQNKKIEKIREFSELDDFYDLPIRCYSTAMQAQLLFSIYVFLDFHLLLIDNILSVCDEYFRLKAFRFLSGLCEGQKSVFMVSNDLNCVRKFAGQVLVIQTGKILFEGEAATAVEFYVKTSDSQSGQYAEKNGITFIQNKDFCFPEETSALRNRAGFSFGDMDWPDEKFFSKPAESENIQKAPIILKRFVFCDKNKVPRFAFPQGGRIYLYGELLVRDVIRIPYIQLELFDQDKKLIHGKNSIQLDIPHPQDIRPGDIIRFCQWVDLGLAAGAYTVSFSVFEIGAADYEKLGQIPVELGRVRKKILLLDPIAALAIFLADEPGPKRLHEGVCNLPGGCWFEVNNGEK